jgi:DNA invertase Pin-like site-specific DNA recombinase
MPLAAARGAHAAGIQRIAALRRQPRISPRGRAKTLASRPERALYSVSTFVDMRIRAVAEGLFVAYYRVSTAKQGRSGLGLEAQQAAVADWLNGGNWRLIAEHTEIESGKRADRPALLQAMSVCHDTGAKLIIAKLDRLSRDVHFLSGLRQAGIEFVAVDMPDANRFTIHIMAAIAEHEREAISARTKAALAAAKARGQRLGGKRANTPPPDWRAGQATIAAQTAARARRLAPLIAELQAAGHTSLGQLSRELAARHIRTVRGGQWSAMAVRNLLGQIAALPPSAGK